MSFNNNSSILSHPNITTEYITSWLKHYIKNNKMIHKKTIDKKDIYDIYQDIKFSNESVNFPIFILNARGIKIENCNIIDFNNFPRSMYSLTIKNCNVSRWDGFDKLTIIQGIDINNCDIPNNIVFPKIGNSYETTRFENEIKIINPDFSNIKASTIYFINCEKLINIDTLNDNISGLQIYKTPNIILNKIPSNLNYLLLDDTYDITNIEKTKDSTITYHTDKHLVMIEF